MKLFVVILMIVVSVNLAGCFSSNPSESDAKELTLKVYKQYIDSGDLVVESVKKTDGKEMELMGVKMYEMAIEVTKKFPKGLDCKHSIAGLCSRHFGASIAPGTSGTTSHKLVFEKSEKGWQYRPSGFGF